MTPRRPDLLAWLSWVAYLATLIAVGLVASKLATMPAETTPDGVPVKKVQTKIIHGFRP